MSERAYKRLHPQLGWRIGAPDGDSLDARVTVLLAGVRKHGTLRAAAHEAQLSYRAAWGLLAHAAQALGEPLVLSQRGTGATVTAVAAALLDHTAAELARIRPLELDSAIARSRAAAPRMPGLRVVASHDLLLADWYERRAQRAAPVASLTFRGSMESLAALAAGKADVAGFHLAMPLDAADSAALHRLLPPNRVTLIRFATREQGLIVAEGNPLRLRGIEDIARRRIRFVNRQAGSGTRMLIDQLLREHGIAPGRVRGYGAEEHTHSAVAALVASGEADAAFGLRAAATHHGLGFVPIRTERYWLAIRAQRAASAATSRLCASLRDPAFARQARRRVGYDTTGAGELAPVAAAFEPAELSHQPVRPHRRSR